MPVAILTAPSAFAGSVPPFTIGPSNAAIVPGADGAINLTDIFGANKELGPKNASSTKIGVIHTAPVPMLDLTNPNGQVDLRQAWLNSAKDADNDDWIYFAWERDAANGSGFIAYEFMKNAAPASCIFGGTVSDATLIANCNPWKNRVGDDDGAGPHTGDFMILWDQQGGSKDLYLRKWTGLAPNLTLGAPTLIPASVGQAEYSADGFRGEAAVNVTDAIYGGVQQCLSFANVIPSTVTGNSDTADYKDTIFRNGINLGGCTTTTTTTPKQADGTTNVPAGGLSITTAGVVQVKDSATITLTGGSGAPGGTVQFALCKASNALNATCDTAATNIGSAVAVGGASFPVTVASPTAWVTAAGRYCWKAAYSGVPASGIAGSSDNSIGECFLINPVTPTLSTSAGADVVLGQAVTDTATLGGTAPQPTSPAILTSAPGARTAAGGTITFKLYGPSDVGCGALVYTSGTVTVSGNNDYSSPAPQHVPVAAGNYHWVAVYSGNSPNTEGVSHNLDCDDTNEDVTVSTVPSSLTSAQTWVPSDSVTVSASAGGDLNGTASFEFFSNGTCTGTADYSTTKSVSGASPVTVLSGSAPAQTASGSFSWRVSYDSDNLAQRDIPPSCHETSALTVANGGTISSP